MDHFPGIYILASFHLKITWTSLCIWRLSVTDLQGRKEGRATQNTVAESRGSPISTRMRMKEVRIGYAV
jgi:hypothetical protein